MKLRILLTVLTVVLSPATIFAQKRYAPPRSALPALSQVTEHSMMSHIRFLSDDLLEGRAPATRGDKLTLAYIASHMEELGLKPGGDNGTYFQKVPVLSLTAAPFALKFSKGNESLTLNYKSEFVGTAGKQQASVEINNAEIIFVGFGIEAPEQQWDDYKGIDVKGKVLLMMNNDPPSDDETFFGGAARTYYGRWTYKYEIAARKGAVGAIIVHTRESAGYGWNVVENSWTGEQFELAQKTETPTTLFNGWTTLEASERLVALAGMNLNAMQERAMKRSFTPIPLGITLSTQIATATKNVETANVIGVFEGSDAKLRDEAVIFTAHHDHLGITTPVRGDSINNGALDNASGVSAVLNLAQMFSSLKDKPKRSIVFATVGAEESGLIGSQHYVEHPLFPTATTAANINIDGINVFGPTKDIVVIGYGRSTIDNVVQKVAAWQNRVVKPDQFPAQGSFYRSDQFNFAKAGVPAIFLDNGVDYHGKSPEFGKQVNDEYIKNDYHQPSDDIKSNWVMSGAIQDVQLAFLIALEIANAPSMPAWKKGDEFEGARLRSLK
jgi:Zn-dependent M28 family amino/carboxypeptidase